MATENNKLNGWVKFLGAIIGLVLSLLILFVTMVKPAVRDAVATQVEVESVQRVEGDQKNYSWGSEEHKNLENRLEKRLDRMEVKIDRLLEQR